MKPNEILQKNLFWDAPDEKYYPSGEILFDKKLVPFNKIISNNLIDSPSTVKQRIKDIQTGYGIPLLLVEPTKNGQYDLIDGNHRYKAIKTLFPKIKNIPVAIFKGTEDFGDKE